MQHGIPRRTEVGIAEVTGVQHRLVRVHQVGPAFAIDRGRDDVERVLRQHVVRVDGQDVVRRRRREARSQRGQDPSLREVEHLDARVLRRERVEGDAQLGPDRSVDADGPLGEGNVLLQQARGELEELGAVRALVDRSDDADAHRLVRHRVIRRGVRRSVAGATPRT